MRAHVLSDTYMWSTAIPGQPIRRQHNVGRRGDVIEISAEEYDRGVELGLLSPAAADAVRAEATDSEPATVEDEQLKAYTARELVAYMSQRPSEAERVVDLEDARDKPRSTVLEAAQRVIEEREAAIAERADDLDRDAAASASESQDRAQLAEDEARAAAAGAPRA